MSLGFTAHRLAHQIAWIALHHRVQIGVQQGLIGVKVGRHSDNFCAAATLRGPRHTFEHELLSVWVDGTVLLEHDVMCCWRAKTNDISLFFAFKDGLLRSTHT